MNIVKVGDYEVGQGHPLLLMAGPCVLEGYEHSLMIGKEVKKIADKYSPVYWKTNLFFSFLYDHIFDCSDGYVIGKNCSRIRSIRRFRFRQPCR